jgi:NAD(P)-dependent dehydrogenase (short-subunit alcohol dehydrogenase family)
MPCRGRVPGTLSTLLFSMYGTKSVVEYKGETKSWYYYSIPHRATKRQFVSFEKNGNILMAQTILVTGSTSGFGRLTVETLARQGYSVFAGMRATTGKNAPVAEELRALAEQEQLALHIVEIDITDETSVRQAIDSIVGSTGRLDVVVNNAGISYSGPLEAFTLEQVQQQFDTNVFSVLRVNRAALPQMRKQGSGLLLQIGSIVGRLAFPFLGLYGATKFALEGLTETYRYELAPFGIDAAIIEPGTFPTAISAKRQVAADSERFALYQSAFDGFAKPFYAENRSATPPNPQDVADAVARVIALPAGERPLHTVVATVAQRQAPEAVNDAVTQATSSYLEMLGILPLVTIVPKEEEI